MTLADVLSYQLTFRDHVIFNLSLLLMLAIGFAYAWRLFTHVDVCSKCNHESENHGEDWGCYICECKEDY